VQLSGLYQPVRPSLRLKRNVEQRLEQREEEDAADVDECSQPRLAPEDKGQADTEEGQDGHHSACEKAGLEINGLNRQTPVRSPV
jgi:hypothetical protein